MGGQFESVGGKTSANNHGLLINHTHGMNNKPLINYKTYINYCLFYNILNNYLSIIYTHAQNKTYQY